MELTATDIAERERLRAAFAEGCFLVMREMRYGIGGCGVCEDVELLEARLEVEEWRELSDEEFF